MAAEAVYKIKEAEETCRETLKNAAQKAKEIVAQAGKDGEEKRGQILDSARWQRQTLLQQAADKVIATCETIAVHGAEEREKILAPDSAKMESAVKLVMERIVGANGNR